MSPKLVRQPSHPRYTRKHTTDTTHVSTLSMQARHPRKHATHASTPLTPPISQTRYTTELQKIGVLGLPTLHLRHQ